MPEGRMLSKSIATSEQVASVSLLADYLFTRMIPHLDSEGRMTGSPRAVRGIVCPLRDDVTTEQVSNALLELHNVGLIVWYVVAGKQYVEFPKFRHHQRGARFDREGESRLPASSTDGTTMCGTYSASAPEHSGPLPRAAGALPLSEVKGSEVKSSKAATAAVRVISRDDPLFAEFWLVYPRRSGGNSRADALKTWRARIADGVDPAEMVAGARRYKTHCDREKLTGGKFVKQAATFLGPGEHWREAWAPESPAIRIVDGWFADAAS